MFQLVFPWYVRFGIDIFLISAPLIYLNSNKKSKLGHPTTHLFEYF